MAIVVLSTVLVYAKASSIIRQDALNFMDINMQTLNQRLAQIYENLVSNLLKVSINNQIIESCSQLHEPASFAEFQQKKEIEGILGNYFADESYLGRILIIRPDGTAIYTGAALVRVKETRDMYKDCLEHPSDQFFSYNGYLGCYRPIYDQSRGIVGIVVFILNHENLDSIFSSLQIPDAMVFSVTDSDTFFAGNVTLPAGYDSFENFMKMLDGVSSGTVEFGTGQYFVIRRPVVGAGISTVGMVRYESLIKDSIKIFQITAVVVFVAVLLSVLISWWLSRLVCRDLRSLRVSMLKIMQGNLLERTEIPQEAELKDLALIFNRMMDRIDVLIQEAAQQEIEKQKIRQDYLNMQIKPHFIYNTLNTVRYVAIRNHQDDLAEAVSAVVELLRAVIGKNDDFVPLSTEINYAKEYVKLQNFRNQSHLQLKVDVPEEVLSSNIPTLALQPLVENACLHGLAEREIGNIEVSATVADGSVHVLVSDGGIGFDVEKQSESRLYGVGISNVFKRMELIYGEAFKGRIESSPGKGTQVELVYPYV